MSPKETALAFVNAINAHDVRRIVELMAEGHVFIDTYNNKEDRESMKTGWPGYFQWFPDYHIEVETVLENGDTIGLFGFASGTFHGRETEENAYCWRLPAAWKVVVEGDKVKVWQVFCDSKIPYEIIEKGEADLI